MKDVARVAGVSHMTVSRVVNGDPGVHPDTAARVDQAVEELGYQRNDNARHLRRKGQRTGAIGLVVDDIANPFWSVLTRAVEDEARDRGYLVLVGSTNDDRGREQEVVSAFCARRVDGLIVVPVAGSQRFLKTQMAMGTQVVCVDRPAEGLKVDTVVVDNRAGAAAGVRHLIEHGHRRIAFLGDQRDIWTAHERYLGYIDALAEAGIGGDPTLVSHGIRTTELAHLTVSRLLIRPDPATAIFAGNNMITIGAVSALSDRGRRRPALVGFDDFPLAEHLTPPVTVVSQDPEELGATACRTLLGRISGDEEPAQTIVLPTKLIVRGTS
jgi:DNA-binding LacI/PurR family transcriptional regulator